MEQQKMDRISELTKLSRERELTEAECEERASLRAEYVSEWRSSLTGVLENTYVDDGGGELRKLEKKE